MDGGVSHDEEELPETLVRVLQPDGVDPSRDTGCDFSISLRPRLDVPDLSFGLKTISSPGKQSARCFFSESLSFLKFLKVLLDRNTSFGFLQLYHVEPSSVKSELFRWVQSSSNNLKVLKTAQVAALALKK